MCSFLFVFCLFVEEEHNHITSHRITSHHIQKWVQPDAMRRRPRLSMMFHGDARPATAPSARALGLKRLKT